MEGRKPNLTQEQRILDHLQTFGSITQIDALKEYGIMRLASRISDLRDKEYDIETTYENSLNRYGEKIRYARYVLRNHNGI